MNVNDWNYAVYTPPKSRLRRILRAPLTLLSFIGALIGGSLWFLLNEPPASNSHSLPLIKAEPEPFKYRPENAGELVIPHQDKLVYERLAGGEADSNHEEQLLPLPDAPVIERPAPSASAEEETPTDDHLDAIASSATAQATHPSLSASLDKDEIASLITALDEASPVSAAPPSQAIAAAAMPSSSPISQTFSDAYGIQLGSLPSRDAAQKEWWRLSLKYKQHLRSLHPHIVERQIPGSKAPLYVLLAGSFKQKERALAVCQALKKGQAFSSCVIVKIKTAVMKE